MSNYYQSVRVITIAAVCLLFEVQQAFSFWQGISQNTGYGQAHDVSPPNFGNKMKQMTIMSHTSFSPFPILSGMKDTTMTSFYENCGATTRHCSWETQTPQSKPHGTSRVQLHFNGHRNTFNDQNNMGQMPLDATNQSPHQQAEVKQVCTISKNICVGNTETCVSNHNCDVAMRITETSTEGTPEASVQSIHYLNNCGIDVTDGSKMPQMFFGIGFATYGETGNLECRTPKASDFKLIFLWKNASMDLEDPSKGICRSKKEDDPSAVNMYDYTLIRSMQRWTSVCNSMNLQEDSGFGLKSFLTKHVATSQYTSFFKAPFDFADTLETQTSADGMVISGIVSE